MCQEPEGEVCRGQLLTANTKNEKHLLKSEGARAQQGGSSALSSQTTDSTGEPTHGPSRKTWAPAPRTHRVCGSGDRPAGMLQGGSLPAVGQQPWQLPPASAEGAPGSSGSPCTLHAPSGHCRPCALVSQHLPCGSLGEMRPTRSAPCFVVGGVSCLAPPIEAPGCPLWPGSGRKSSPSRSP